MTSLQDDQEPQETAMIEERTSDGLQVKKMRKATPTTLVRDGGRSLLPFSRVQKIIRADKDLPMVAKEATFLISVAAEEFIKRLAEASQMIANRENRAMVQQRDVAAVVRKADEFLFLEEIIPWMTTTSLTRQKPNNSRALETSSSTPTLLDHYVLTTFHPSSSVSHSLKCCLTADSNIEHLVVAKLNRIDVYSLRPTGLSHECGLEIWGKILSLKAIPVSGSRHSNLLVMLDHPDPELMFLSYSVSHDGADLTTVKRLSLYERSARQAEYLNDIVLNPSGQLAVVSCYTGKLKLILLKDGIYESDFDVSVSELTILALAFVSSDTQTLAILHFDSEERMQLLSRDIRTGDLESPQWPSALLPNTLISAKILPMTDTLPILIFVPPTPEDLGFPGGVLLIGGRKILFFELASREWQEKHVGKERRLETRKKSTDMSEVQKARQKELERRRRPSAGVEWPWSEVTACCGVDNVSRRYLLSDSFGRLAMLWLDVSADNELTLLPLGESSPATTLTYLTTQVLYLGSHMGDSQLLRINPTPTSALDSPTLIIPADITTLPQSLASSNAKGKGKANSHAKQGQGSIIDGRGKYISVLETYKNIAPISDAVLVDTDGSGQRQIVTCSGGQNTGSLNVIRNGADFEELAIIGGIVNVSNIWPVRATFEDKLDTDIVVSTLEDTHLFRLNGRNSVSRVDPVSISFITNQPTLALANIPRRRRNIEQAASYYENSSLVVQVTPKGAVLLEFQLSSGEYTRVGEVWTADRMTAHPLGGRLSWRGRDVVAASINPSQVALALKGSILVVLNLLENDEFNVVSYRDLSANGCEISAVSCAPPDPAKYFSTYIVVSFWQSNHIELVSIERSEPYLQSVCKTRTLPSLPRSLLLLNFDTDQLAGPNCVHLLAGLSDGTVVSLVLSNKEFIDEKIVALGDSPVSLTVCEVDGRRTVFACGSRVSIFSWDKKRLLQSPVLLKNIAAASRLNTKGFYSCLILATPTTLSIGKARDLDRIHIRSFPLGLDNPRRITHDPLLNVFGICCVRPQPARVGDPEFSRSSFRLLDGTSFSHLSQFNCEPNEEITAVETLAQGGSMSFFCVGTFYYQLTEHEPTDGRLLVFSVGQHSGHTSQLGLIASAHVQGCVYALATINGLIAAAVNASVVIFRVERQDESVTLQKVAEWTHNYVVRNLVSHGEILILGDAIHSISVLKLAEGQLQTVARDYGPLWPVCVQALDERTIVAASGDLNIFTFALRHSETQMVLEREGNYHVAEMITKFLPGTLVSRDICCDFLLEAKQLLFTSSGRIGIIIDIEEALSLHMTALQRNMANIAATGHTKFRAPKNPRGHSDSELSSFGFLDGDLLEQLLDYSKELVERIHAGGSEIERLAMPMPQIQKILETLRSMH